MSGVVIGQVLGGKYRVERILGQGGMGVVVAAMHLQLGQHVALKFLLPEALQNPEVRGRFLREAQAAARLRSPHVARVLDVGTLETGSPFIVMELLEGEDLASILHRNGPLPVPTAAAWILEACEAIAEAHALGIIHRDLKPSNLFLARGAGQFEVVKVFDFGISKAPSTPGFDLSLTRTTAVLGSPGYASPEQLRSTKTADHRTDIWALGVTLYQLVSGNVPWSADTLPELTIKIAMDPAPPLPPQLGVPAAFERIIGRCLEKDPGHRYPTVTALAEALAPFSPTGDIAVDRVRRASAGGTAGGSSGTTLQGSAGELRTSRWQRKRARTYGVMGALLVVGGIAAAAIAGAHGGDDDRPVATVSHDARPQVVTAPPDAHVAVVVAPPPDAAPAVVVVAAPDAGVASTNVPHDDRYHEILKEAARVRRSSCARAVALYESAIDLEPRASEALIGLGECLLDLEDYDRAISNFRAALGVARRSPDALFGAAQAYEGKGRTADAMEYYKRYLEVAPRGDRADRARRALEVLKSGGSDEDLFGTGRKK